MRKQSIDSGNVELGYWRVHVWEGSRMRGWGITSLLFLSKHCQVRWEETSQEGLDWLLSTVFCWLRWWNLLFFKALNHCVLCTEIVIDQASGFYFTTTQTLSASLLGWAELFFYWLFTCFWIKAGLIEKWNCILILIWGWYVYVVGSSVSLVILLCQLMKHTQENTYIHWLCCYFLDQATKLLLYQACQCSQCAGWRRWG